MDIITFLGLDYREAALIILQYVVLGISISEISWIIISHE